MRRFIGSFRRPRHRDIPAELILVVLLGALGMAGFRVFSGRDPGVPQTLSSASEIGALPGSGGFSEMRPRAGDQMVPPRIGFRWNFDPKACVSRASEASFLPSFFSDSDSISVMDLGRLGMRFLLHLVGPGGQPVLTRETTEASFRLNLTDGFPSGECEWWVEAIPPGGASISSPKEHFTLRR